MEPLRTTIRPAHVIEAERTEQYASSTGWVWALDLLWSYRRLLLRVGAIALLLSGTVAFLLPKHYESKTRIMPPEQQGGTTAFLAALSGRALPASMGTLAGSLLGMRNTGALFVDLLQSRTVEEHLVDRFDLQKLYWTRYRQNAIKRLARRTDVVEDRKSGIISITVTDTDRRRARDMAQAYVDELDQLVAKVNTSTARRERIFIEQRLNDVRTDLDDAQRDLGQFSSKNATLDIKEQTRAMVEAGAKLQAQLIVTRSEVGSLQQLYGDGNVRLRAAQARERELQRELEKMSGTSDGQNQDSSSQLYPPLRQLPLLAVQWADLYRRVKVQESVFELLTQQYELARIEEAKSIPTVRVVDPPSWPEKKSFPPRLIIMLLSVAAALMGTSFWLIASERFRQLPPVDPRKLLATQVWTTLRHIPPRAA